MPRPAMKRTSINISPSEAMDFANKLAYDDDFRARVEREPAEVFAEYNIFIPEDQVPKQVTLPPKEELQKTLSQISTDRDFREEVAVIPVFLAFLAFFAFARER